MACMLRWHRSTLPVVLLFMLAVLPVTAQVTTEVLARVPAKGHVTVGPDGRVIAWYVPVGAGADIYINGKLESHSDGRDGMYGDARDLALADTGTGIHFTFSHDGVHYAYLIEQHQRVIAMIDGKPAWKGEASLGDEVAFSPGGKHFWLHYGADMIDGVAAPELGPYTLVFSPVDDAKVLGDHQRDYRVHLSRDGKEIAVADALHILGCLPDGRLAWVAGTQPQGKETHWTHAIYVDGVLTEKLAWDEDCTQAVGTPDGKHTAFVIEQQSGRPTLLLLDGVRSHPQWGRIVSLTLTPDGTPLAVFHEEKWGGSQEFVVEHDNAGPTFSHIECAAFSPSYKHFAYVGCQPDGTRTLYVDGSPVTPDLPSAPLVPIVPGQDRLYIPDVDTYSASDSTPADPTTPSATPLTPTVPALHTPHIDNGDSTTATDTTPDNPNTPSAAPQYTITFVPAPDLPPAPNLEKVESAIHWDADEHASVTSTVYHDNDSLVVSQASTADNGPTVTLQYGAHSYGSYTDVQSEHVNLGADGVCRYLATTDPQGDRWDLYADGVLVEGTHCRTPGPLLDTPNGLSYVALRAAENDETEVVRITVPVPGRATP